MKKALYIPAYSDGLMGMFYGKSDQEIAQENQEEVETQLTRELEKGIEAETFNMEDDNNIED